MPIETHSSMASQERPAVVGSTDDQQMASTDGHVTASVQLNHGSETHRQSLDRITREYGIDFSSMSNEGVNEGAGHRGGREAADPSRPLVGQLLTDTAQREQPQEGSRNVRVKGGPVTPGRAPSGWPGDWAVDEVTGQEGSSRTSRTPSGPVARPQTFGCPPLQGPTSGQGCQNKTEKRNQRRRGPCPVHPWCLGARHRGRRIGKGQRASPQMCRGLQLLGDVPLAGFFAGGEIAHHHLYGYTGVLTVFVDSEPLPS